MEDSFNPDISKQALEITFSKKNWNASYPPLYFNKSYVVLCSYQKHLGVFLDKEKRKEKIAKTSKGIDAIKKINNVISRNSLWIIYKWFTRPHLDYRNNLYHQPNNESVNSKLENLHNSAAMAITGVIKETSRSKLYKDVPAFLNQFKSY